VRAQSIQHAFERIELLAGFAKPARGSEALVVSEVFSRFRNEGIEI
jgi:hypothetical protein